MNIWLKVLGLLWKMMGLDMPGMPRENGAGVFCAWVRLKCQGTLSAEKP
jgi:hypothetical protein